MRSASRGSATLKVEVSTISSQGVGLRLGSEEIFLPFAEFPWFREATVESVLHVERPSAHHLYWPKLDVDVDVESIRAPERYPLISRERPRPTVRRSAKQTRKPARRRG